MASIPTDLHRRIFAKLALFQLVKLHGKCIDTPTFIGLLKVKLDGMNIHQYYDFPTTYLNAIIAYVYYLMYNLSQDDANTLLSCFKDESNVLGNVLCYKVYKSSRFFDNYTISSALITRAKHHFEQMQNMSFFKMIMREFGIIFTDDEHFLSTMLSPDFTLLLMAIITNPHLTRMELYYDDKVGDGYTFYFRPDASKPGVEFAFDIDREKKQVIKSDRAKFKALINFLNSPIVSTLHTKSFGWLQSVTRLRLSHDYN